MPSIPQTYITIAICVVAGLLALLLTVFIVKLRKKRKIKRKIQRLALKAPDMSPADFFKMRNQKLKETKNMSEFEFSGVYVIYNRSKNKYYVGQAVKIISRVNNHFTGKGNGDVYADYKYKDKFKIQLFPLKNSGFSSLNELERVAIHYYKAYKKGYNKTKGNKN